MIKIAQINLGRGQAALQESLQAAEQQGISILMAQEPYVGAKAHITCKYRVIQKDTGNKEKPVKSAVIVVNPNIQYCVNQKIITENIVACRLCINEFSIGVINVYLEEGADIEDDLCNITRFIENLDTEHVILEGDFNAKSPWRGCDAGDRRGVVIAETLAQLDLQILNEGQTPTFHVWRGAREYSSIIDITTCTTALLNRITDWKVDPNLITLSDHRAITFNLNIKNSNKTTHQRISTRIYNTSKADWETFTKRLREELNNSKVTHDFIDSIDTPQLLEKCIQSYITSILSSCEDTIPVLLRKIPKKTQWWNKELQEKKREVIKKRRKIKYANERRKPFVIEDYIQAKADYKNLIMAAMTTSWKQFCTRQDKENIWQSIYRIIRKNTTTKEDTLLKSSAETNTLSPEQSARLLANTFYPTDDNSTDDVDHIKIREKATKIRENLNDSKIHIHAVPFTATEVETVFNNMSPKKSPGGDGLTSDICYKSYLAEPETLLKIFNKCLSLGYFPQEWKNAVIRVIPKPNKEDYTIAKAYRPIGLLPILGKVLEKLFVTRLTWQLGHENKLSGRQYGFLPQRGTEDALYDALEIVKESLRNKEIAVIVSLDIEGAFDNAWWPAVITELQKRDADPAVLRLIMSYLSERSITLRYANAEVTKNTNKGCIQGSICGPLMWNVLLDSLLQETEKWNVHVQAYADDIIVIGSGKDAKQIEEKINLALEHISNWGISRKMNFAAHKTQAILITKKIKYELPNLKLNNTKINFSEDLKILGLIVDRKLNFVKHVDDTTKRAIALYKKVSRTARAQWGLNSEILRTIYLAVVEPTILYAAACWGSVANKVQIRKKLDRITRMFSIMICKAHRTSSLISSTALARIIPLDLRAQEQKELYLIKRGKPLIHLPGRMLAKPISPFTLPHPAERVRESYDLICTQEDVNMIQNNWPTIYTDGSRISGMVGAAVSCWKEGKEVYKTKLKLSNYCSVYQAELAAILKALTFVKSKNEFNKANILSDSRSALECLSNPSTVHPIAAEILTKINEIRNNRGDVKLYWIKAHCGILGNERGDELAKLAAETSKQAPVYDCFPLSYAKRQLRDNTINTWQERYTKAETGAVTRRFFPDVTESYKTIEKINVNNLISQILTGHGGFKAYLFRFKLAESPYCSCDNQTSQTIEHILIDCPKFQLARLECELRMGFVLQEETLNRAINNNDSRTHFLKFAISSVEKIVKENKT
ncbi:unnamed protein product [Parnassius mnemosyne]|uniref:Uncharacterized protein n=1 Tax=Parnassius mnemosyne TaxID=213953 RepID=A0AAV1KSC6_9NEOP